MVPTPTHTWGDLNRYGPDRSVVLIARSQLCFEFPASDHQSGPCLSENSSRAVQTPPFACCLTEYAQRYMQSCLSGMIHAPYPVLYTRILSPSRRTRMRFQKRLRCTCSAKSGTPRAACCPYRTRQPRGIRAHVSFFQCSTCAAAVSAQKMALRPPAHNGASASVPD